MSTRNCLSCKHYLKCKDPAKSVIYKCSRFDLYKDSNLESLMRQATLLGQDVELDFDHKDPKSWEKPEEEEYQDNEIYKNIEKVINEKRLVPPDMRIPEGDFAKAPNFYTWCISEHFAKSKPFIEQAILGTTLFADFCPKCSNMSYIEHEHSPKDSLFKFEKNVALLEHGKCPHCKSTRLKLFKKKLLHPYQEASVVWGQRSGKNQFLAMASSYHTHRIIKLEDPIKVYNAIKSVTLMMSFIALTAGQSKDTCWEPYLTYITESPWFTSYISMLKEMEYKYGEGSLYKVKDTFVQFKHRRFVAHFSGPDERVLRGKTRTWATIDELGLFPVGQKADGKVKMNGPAVYQALKRSITTIRLAAIHVVKQGFYDVPFAYFVNVSSPRSTRDMIMTRYRASIGSRTILGSKKATWEVNPHVPRKALAEEFKSDPIGSERDYGANPPLSGNPFISNEEAVSQCFSKKKNMLKLRNKYLTTRNGQRELYAVVDKIEDSGKPSVLALDAGSSFNSFAFAVGHRSKNGYPVISLVGEVIPEPGTKINFNKMYKEVITDIVLHRNIRVCAADRWNSLKLLSDLDADFGIVTHQYSVKYADMVLCKDYLIAKQILIPAPVDTTEAILAYDHSNYPHCFKGKPADHLYLQLVTVQDALTTVIKGDDLTDDIARAVFLCVAQILNTVNDEHLNVQDKEVKSAVNISDLVVIRRGSGGGNFSGNSNPLGLSNIGVMKTYKN